MKREAQNWDPTAVFVENRYISKETWFDRNGKGFQPQVHYFVGGATKMYGAALYRLRKEDFGELKHYDGISPAWPIGYDEMEPYYTKAEQMYQVHGVDGLDPTEPPFSAPYPDEPVSNEPRIEKLYKRFKSCRLPSFSCSMRGDVRRAEYGLQQMYPLPDLRWLSLPGTCEVGCRGDRRPPGARVS